VFTNRRNLCAVAEIKPEITETELKMFRLHVKVQPLCCTASLNASHFMTFACNVLSPRTTMWSLASAGLRGTDINTTAV